MKCFLTEFEHFLTQVKKCSANTYNAYTRDVIRFTEYCKTKKIKDVTSVAQNDIEKFLLALQSEGLSNSSLVHVLAALRCYFLFLKRSGYVLENPAASIKPGNSDKKLPKVFSVKEINLLLSQPKGNDHKSIRDKAMLDLMYATGIKVSELVQLKLYDVNLSVGILLIQDGKHERIIPIYPDALKSLNLYITKVRPAIVLDNDEEHLFTNMTGQPLSRQGFWKILKMYAKQAKLDDNITSASFRHSFATHLLENGADLNDIKEMLGHADISTTNVYARLIKNKYTLSYNKFHPLAK